MIVPPTRPLPLPRIVTGCSVARRVFRQQLFFGHAALRPQRLHLHRVELRALGRELLFEVPRQRQVDIVAAEQDVFAHRGAFQLQFAA